MGLYVSKYMNCKVIKSYVLYFILEKLNELEAYDHLFMLPRYET